MPIPAECGPQGPSLEWDAGKTVLLDPCPHLMPAQIQELGCCYIRRELPFQQFGIIIAHPKADDGSHVAKYGGQDILAYLFPILVR